MGQPRHRRRRYRDYWLMEALANYSALLYLEKSKGAHSVDTMLESYRTALLAKNEAGQMVDSAGPIVLGPRLETSLEPRAWRTITYGKGSWIIHMLRRRHGRRALLRAARRMAKRYDHKKISTDEFRDAARRSSCRRNRTTRSWRASSSSGSTARASRR